MTTNVALTAFVAPVKNHHSLGLIRGMTAIVALTAFVAPVKNNHSLGLIRGMTLS